MGAKSVSRKESSKSRVYAFFHDIWDYINNQDCDHRRQHQMIDGLSFGPIYSTDADQTQFKLVIINLSLIKSGIHSDTK